MKHPLLIVLILLASAGHAQTLSLNRDKIDEAGKEMNTALVAFNGCILNSDADRCISDLVKSTSNGYQKFIVGSVLYDIDKEQSFMLNKEAYLAAPADLNLLLEYAIALHRKGAYAAAAKLYEQFQKQQPTDYRLNVWLADCYINTGDIAASAANWEKADHAKNHTGIENAIYTVNSNSTQIKKRNNYRREIEKGNVQALYPLVFLDMNWETDWWNAGAQYYFLNEDIALAKKKLGENNKDLRIALTYLQVKQLSGAEGKADSIRLILKQEHLMPGTDALPPNGLVASDLLRICFLNHLLPEKDYYKAHGDELLTSAKKTKDIELLNVYAYLQATVNGKVDPSIDRLGWKEFKDERFAMSYFVGKGDKNRYNDPELIQAIADFPNSSGLFWLRTYCAKLEHKELRPILIELVRKEFKTLGSGNDRFSSSLNLYYAYLKEEK